MSKAVTLLGAVFIFMAIFLLMRYVSTGVRGGVMFYIFLAFGVSFLVVTIIAYKRSGR
jgi:hypothetical protein